MNILSATFYVSFLLVICFCKPTTKPLRKQNKKYDIAMNCPILCSLFKHIQCDNPSCEMVDWNLQNNFTSNKIVLSYGHNGLGNQFYQHSFALSVANAIGARLLVAKIPPTLYLANKEPRHTDVAFELVTQMIPSSNLYENLPMDSYLRKLCTYEAYFLGDRPKDIKNGVGSEASFDKLIQLLSDDQPRCLKLVGYFQEQPLCKYKLRHVWSLEKVLSSQSSVNYTEIVHIAPLQTSSAKSNRDQSSAQNTQHGITYWDWFNETEHSYGLQRPARGHGHSQKPTEFHGGQVLNITHLFEPVIASMSEVLANQYVPRPMDVCIYLRCLPKHYHMNAPLYYDTLLGSMQYDRVIIFENPQCHHPLEADHTVANVRKHLYSTKGIKGSRCVCYVCAVCLQFLDVSSITSCFFGT